MLPPLPSTYCRSHSLRPTRRISFRKASASGELAAARGVISSTFRVSALDATPALEAACAASLPFSAAETAVCCILDLTPTPGQNCRAPAITGISSNYIECRTNVSPKPAIPTWRTNLEMQCSSQFHSYTGNRGEGGGGGGPW